MLNDQSDIQMSRLPPYLQYLPAFEATARLGSVRQAAEELHLSPSAISLQLKKLSDATGIVLLQKSGRNVSLTQAGRDFSQTVAISLGQLDTATRASRKLVSGDHPSSLSVSVPTALGIAWLTATLVDFAQTHGISNLTINEAITAAEVDWTGNDLAIVYDNPPFTGKYWRLLSQVRLCAVCSPTLFPRLDLRNRDGKLSSVALLHEDDGGEWAKWSIAARIALEGNTRVRVNSVAQAIASAVQGRGVALVSDVLTRNFLSEGRLIQPFSTTINAAREYYIVCAVDRANDPVLRTLADHVVEQLRPGRDQNA
jgi:LysR family glycine cleavage system transcriptional activator